jgi:hypothetical protein
MNRFERQLGWHLTGDAYIPWDAFVDGQHWEVRINDVPKDRHVYTLLVEGEPVTDFDDWPAAWTRPPLPEEPGWTPPEPQPHDPSQDDEAELERKRSDWAQDYANNRRKW